MAIRRNPTFRFNYYLRSLPVEAIGRRCEQLMKAAEREVEAMEKKVREQEASNTGEEEKKEASAEDLTPIDPAKLPRFREIRAMKRKEAEQAVLEERKQLEKKVEDIETQMEAVQKRMKELQKYAKENVSKSKKYMPKSSGPNDTLTGCPGHLAKQKTPK